MSVGTRTPEIVLNAIGFWRTSALSVRLPHPRELVDRSWNRDHRDNLIRYLRNGHSVNGYCGFSYCRFSDGPPPEEMGDSDLTDGCWVWPEGLAIYVDRYHVKLPDDFLRFARANNFALSEGRLSKVNMYTRYSYDYWIEWVQRNRSSRLRRFIARLAGVGRESSTATSSPD
jgi:hypothetical protein